jgi:DNA-3-methyladenine glycosylase
MTSFDLSFLDNLAEQVAPRLLGCILERDIDGQAVRVKIVETEAYDQTDEASHSYRGRTVKNEVMFGPAGHLYVYFTYGMHYCCNIVVGENGYGAAVLIRAVEPITGEATLAKRRVVKRPVELTNGPAKLTQALAIDRELNGHDLTKSPLKLYWQPSLAASQVSSARRVGISRGQSKLWRFYITDNPYLSIR